MTVDRDFSHLGISDVPTIRSGPDYILKIWGLNLIQLVDRSVEKHVCCGDGHSLV